MPNIMQMYGKIVSISEPMEIGQTKLLKQTLELLEVGEDGDEMIKNPDKIMIDVLGSMCDYVAQRKVGELVKCGISLGVNESKDGRKFNNIRLFAIIPIMRSLDPIDALEEKKEAKPEKKTAKKSSDDDLPF